MFHPLTEIASDTVGDADVSTVFTIYGDYSVSPANVYGVRVRGGSLDGYEHGYPTEAEALEAHAVIVQRLRRDQTPAT